MPVKLSLANSSIGIILTVNVISNVYHNSRDPVTTRAGKQIAEFAAQICLLPDLTNYSPYSSFLSKKIAFSHKVDCIIFI